MSKVQELYAALSKEGVFQQPVEVELNDDIIVFTFESLKEFPVYAIVNDVRVKCWTSLAPMDAIKEDDIPVLNQTMLVANDITPLSNFTILDNEYCMVGELSSESLLENIVLELETLVNNSEDALTDLIIPSMK